MLKPPVGGSRASAYAPIVVLLVGTAVGGAGLGIIVSVGWLILDLIPGLRQGLAFGMVLFAAVATLPALRLWVPERNCQVASARLLKGGLVQATMRWGIVLGLGLCTFIVTPAIYALIGAGLGLHHVSSVPILFVTYGTIRGATIAWFAVGRVQQRRSPDSGLDLKRGLRIPLLGTLLLSMTLMLGAAARGW